MQTIIATFANNALNVTYGLYGLLVGSMGTYINRSLNCETQFTMMNNIFLRNLMMIMILFIGISSTSTQKLHPAIIFIKSFLIWLMFMGLNRMQPFNTGVAVIIIIMLFIMRAYRDYLEEESQYSGVMFSSTTEAMSIDNTESIMLLGLIINIVIGVYLSWENKKKQMNFKEFLFDVPKCRGKERLHRQI